MTGDSAVAARSNRGPADWFRSLGLVLLVVAVVTFIGPARTLIGGGKSRVPAVGYSTDVNMFHRLVGRPVLAPRGLPAGWKPTSVRLSTQPPVLHIGLLTPKGQYVDLEESPSAAAAVHAAQVAWNAAAAHQVLVGGILWQEAEGAGGHAVLVRSVGGMTTVLAGTAGPVEMSVLAGHLVPG